MASHNRGRRFPARALSKDEVDSFLKSFSRRAPSAIRNRCLAVILYRCGCRISEALSLKPSDVDLKEATLYIREGKSRPRTRKEMAEGKPLKKQQRIVGLDALALEALERWMDVRRKRLGLNGTHKLFTTLRGNDLSSGYVRGAFARKAKKVGLERVNPHSLRHSYASELRREGVDLGVISQALGHSSLVTTHRYTRHLSPQEVLTATRSRDSGTPKPNPLQAKLQELEAQLEALKALANG